MINEYKKNDISKILNIINDASLRYKGIIPDDCWHEPYMSEKELFDELDDGVHMYGYDLNNKLIGVIGIQEVKDVILIRHAYTLISQQNKGIGSVLLNYLLKKNQNSRLLVGTWKNATWAIRFYEKFGFTLHSKEQSTFSQEIKMDGAIIISTPQEVALLDVKRGIKMFDKLGVKILGLVDNMSFFIGDDGKKYKIFGEVELKELQKNLIKNF